MGHKRGGKSGGWHKTLHSKKKGGRSTLNKTTGRHAQKPRTGTKRKWQGVEGVTKLEGKIWGGGKEHIEIRHWKGGRKSAPAKRPQKGGGGNTKRGLHAERGFVKTKTALGEIL